MKTKTVKALALILAAVLCLGPLAGCGGTPQILGSGGFSAAELVRGNLDLIYLDKYTDQYLKSVSLSAEDAHQTYEDGIAKEADYFIRRFELMLDQCPDDTRDRVLQLFRDIYSHARYEVGEQTQSGDAYLVPVTVYPIDALRSISDTALDTFGEKWTARKESGEFNGCTQEEFDAAFELAWAECILALADLGLDSCGYLDPEIVSVRVAPDENGRYAISDGDFSRIDSLIIAY